MYTLKTVRQNSSILTISITYSLKGDLYTGRDQIMCCSWLQLILVQEIPSYCALKITLSTWAQSFSFSKSFREVTILPDSVRLLHQECLLLWQILKAKLFLTEKCKCFLQFSYVIKQKLFQVHSLTLLAHGRLIYLVNWSMQFKLKCFHNNDEWDSMQISEESP